MEEPGVDAESSASEQKPPQNSATLDSIIERTQRLLEEVISRPSVTPQLLRKPPVKFIRDVFREVSLATGFGKGLFTDEALENCITTRESKFVFLISLVHTIAWAVDEPNLVEQININKVASETEPEKTNLLLQKLHEATTTERCKERWEEATRRGKEAPRHSPWFATQTAGSDQKLAVSPPQEPPASAESEAELREVLQGLDGALRDKALSECVALATQVSSLTRDLRRALEHHSSLPAAQIKKFIARQVGLAMEDLQEGAAQTTPPPVTRPPGEPAANRPQRASLKVQTAPLPEIPATPSSTSTATQEAQAPAEGLRTNSKDRMEVLAKSRASTDAAQNVKASSRRASALGTMNYVPVGAASNVAASPARSLCLSKRDLMRERKRATESQSLCTGCAKESTNSQHGGGKEELCSTGSNKTGISDDHLRKFDEQHGGGSPSSKGKIAGKRRSSALNFQSNHSTKSADPLSPKSVVSTKSADPLSPKSAVCITEEKDRVNESGATPENHHRDSVDSRFSAKSERRQSRIERKSLAGGVNNLQFALIPDLDTNNELLKLLNVPRLDMDAVKELLKNKEFDLDAPMEEKLQVPSPLFFCTVKLKSPGLVKLLIESRADVTLRFPGAQAWGVVEAGMTVLDACSRAKQDFRDTILGDRLANIEELLKAEVDRLRGWEVGRRVVTRSLTWTNPQVKKIHSDGGDGEDSSDEELSEDEVLLDEEEEELRAKSQRRQSLYRSNTTDVSRRSLYQAKAAILSEHIDGDPAEQYDMAARIGEGTFGSVRKGVHKQTGVIRAIKTVPKALLEDSGLWQEINIMRMVDHPNVMRLYATFEDANAIYMVSEICLGGELFDSLLEAGNLTEHAAAKLIKQMFGAIAYLHADHICHRDLKPENFMVAQKTDVVPLENAQVKLIDFGTAKKFGPGLPPLKTKICTVHYVAPEVLSKQEKPYSERCDVWSLGVVLFVMLSGSPPFWGESDMEVLKKIKKGKYNFEPAEVWEQVSEDATKLVKKMLVTNPDKRYSAKAALNDMWVQELAPNSKGNAILHQHILGNMRAFQAQNRLKKFALQVIAQQVSDESIGHLRTVFFELDDSNSGVLRVDQIEGAIQKLGMEIDVQLEMTQLLKEMDKEGTGAVNWTHFLAATIDKRHYMKEESCRAAFLLFDMDGDDMISLTDLECVLANDASSDASHALAGALNADIENLEQIMREADKDGDGMISFEDFMSMMNEQIVGHQTQSSDAHRLSLLQDDEAALAAAMLEANAGKLEKRESQLKRSSTSKAVDVKKLVRSATMQLTRSGTQVLKPSDLGGGAVSLADHRKKKENDVEGEEASQPVAKKRSSLKQNNRCQTEKVDPKRLSTYDSSEGDVQRPRRNSVLQRTETVIFKKPAEAEKAQRDSHLTRDSLETEEIQKDLELKAALEQVPKLPEGQEHKLKQFIVPPEGKINMGGLRDFLVSPPCSQETLQLYLDAQMDIPQNLPAPLFFAVGTRNVPLLRLLLEHKADVRYRFPGPKSWNGIEVGMTPLSFTTSRKMHFKDTDLMLRYETMEELLLSEADRLRGWTQGQPVRRGSTSMSLSGASDGRRLSVTAIATPAPDEDQADPDKERELEERATKQLESRASQDHPRASQSLRKSLYRSKAGFVCAHIDGDPEEHYDFEDKIGEGTFGSVRIARHRKMGSCCAVKTIPKILLEDSGLWQEVEMMRKVDHPHITRLYCTFEDLSNIYMFSEYCSGGELFEKLVEVGKFPEEHCKRIIRQMVAAVCYLHGQNICHRDLKPENFLFARPVKDFGEAHIKLIDFGTARKFGPGTKPMTTKICSLHYVAPEILSKKEVNYNEKCDVWSLGVLLYLVLSGMTPFYGDSEMQILKMVKKARYTFDPPDIWDTISDIAKELIQKCMQVSPDQRPDLQDIANHEWVVSASKSCSKISRQQLIDNMRAFKSETRMKKVALQVIAQYLDDERISELRIAFLELDTQSKGSLTFAQVEQAVKKAGVVMDSDTELRDLLTAMSSRHSISDAEATSQATEDTPLCYSQFLAATIDRKQYLSEEVLREAFNTFDVNGLGEFGKEEMLLVFSGNLSETIDFDQLCDNVESIIDEVAPEGVGMLNYDKFVEVMKAEPRCSLLGIRSPEPPADAVPPHT